MLKAVIQNIRHHIFEGTVELSVIVPMPSPEFGVIEDLAPKELKKEAIKHEKEYDAELERLLKSIRLGAIKFDYITDKKEASNLVSQCGKGEQELGHIA